MTIATLNDYIGSAKQVIPISKLVARTVVANVWFSLLDIDGNPGKGVLAGTSTAAGVVPTDATAGFSPILFSTGTGYLTIVDYGSTVASRLALGDLVFKAGAYNWNNGTTNLASQPSYSGRMPGGSYVGTEIWLECASAFTSGTTWSVTVTYTDQDGNTGHTTGAITPGVAQTIGRMQQLPLAAGDSGVSKIESVVTSTGNASAGTFNILVVRPLWTGRVGTAGGGESHGLDRTGMPQVFGDSALFLQVIADSTSSGYIDMDVEIASA